MRVLSALGIALSLATAVAAQEETRRHSSDDSKYTFAVPANWEIGPLKGKCVFAFKADRVTRLDYPHLARVLDSQRAGTLALMTERVFLWTLDSLLEKHQALKSIDCAFALGSRGGP